MKKITQQLLVCFLLSFLSTNTLTAKSFLPPVLTCPSDITVPNDPGVCGATVDYIGMASAIDPEDGDISAAIITTSGPTSGTVFPIGLTVVELSVTDTEGNTETCMFNVTVNDVESPTITCPADVNTNNDPGTCGAAITFMVDGMDNCAGGTTSGELTTTFLDNNGQSGIMFDITASGGEDVSIYEFLGHIGPGFGAQNVDIWYMVGSHVGFETDDTPWLFHESVNATDNGNMGPGGNVVTPLVNPLVIPAGVTYGVFYVTDGPQNLDYTEGTDSFADAFITVDSGSGKALGTGHPFDGLTFTPRHFNGTIYYTTGSIDVMQTTGLPSGSVFPVGTTTNTFEITDASGNTASCSFDVTVIDNEAPTVTCPTTINMNTDPGLCSAVVNYDVPTSDNCPGETSIQTAGLASGSVFPVGTTTNSFEVTDAAGFTTTCSFDVIVTDMEPPTVNCIDITVQLDATGNVSISETDVDGGSTDNCGVATTSIDVSSFTCSDVGPNNVTLSVTDVNGVVATCTAIVTVQDVDPPTAVCQNITVQLDATGNGTINAADVDAGSSDICGIGGLSVDIDSFDCSDIGDNNVVLVVTDLSGNSTNCMAVVTVEDTMAPTMVCQDITVQLDGSGMATIVPSDIDGGTTDNCGGITSSIDVTMFDCTNIGPNNVTLTTTDSEGNSDTCVAVVTVQELQAPIVICQDITIALDAAGMASITPADIDGGSSDNCAIASMTINNDSFTCANVGIPNNVTLTVTDTAGNVSSCSAIVTVEDTIPISAICQNITVNLDNDGEVIIQPEDIDGGSFDNCGVSNLSISQSLFTCANVGPNDVTLTVTNSNGETATCVAVVTVEETIFAPMAICQNITAPLQADGTVTIFPEAVNNNSIGIGCNGTLSLDLFTFTCDDVGDPIEVTLTVTNELGVSDTCTALVNVVDSLDPAIECPENQFVTSEGPYTLPDYFDIGLVSVADNCENNLLITQQPPPGTILEQGSYNITMQVEDPSENIATCVFQLTIDDLLGIENPADMSSLLVYPNPAQEFIALANPQNIRLEKLSVYDITGRLIKTVPLQDMGIETRIDISELASATYILIVSSETTQTVINIVKE